MGLESLFRSDLLSSSSCFFTTVAVPGSIGQGTTEDKLDGGAEEGMLAANNTITHACCSTNKDKSEAGSRDLFYVFNFPSVFPRGDLCQSQSVILAHKLELVCKFLLFFWLPGVASSAILLILINDSKLDGKHLSTHSPMWVPNTIQFSSRISPLTFYATSLIQSGFRP